MKDFVAYIFTFLLAFIFITGGIFIFNEKYENMWQFNFAPRGAQALADSLAKKHVDDSLKAKNQADSLARLANGDTTKPAAAEVAATEGAAKEQAGHHAEETKHETADKGKHTAEPAKPNTEVKNEAPAKNPEEYKKWVKETAKLYAGMDAKQVAKVITTFPDATARDLIYAMNKKKASEVLSFLAPDVVHRITKVQ